MSVRSEKDRIQPRNPRGGWVRRAIALLFVLQALLITIQGNLDILSGKSHLAVIPWIASRGIELLMKAQKFEKKKKHTEG